ncbi:MAG: His/Gly/Thr/Pro-type tRNA ligase C-terminal domain-containing protein, partial [Coriobacteriia bacterium]|nr:His/Gly/Thr/Pro-type tRNA ligase C-terminal domain-containing protein [Coriobacteriia bacterium]
HQARSLKSQFKSADRLGARFVVVVGPDEIATGQVTVRDMTAGTESRVEIRDLDTTIIDRLRG